MRRPLALLAGTALIAGFAGIAVGHQLSAPTSRLTERTSAGRHTDPAPATPIPTNVVPATPATPAAPVPEAAIPTAIPTAVPGIPVAIPGTPSRRTSAPATKKKEARLPEPKDCAAGDASGYHGGSDDFSNPMGNDHDRGAACLGRGGSNYFYAGGHPHTGCGEVYVMDQKMYDFTDGPEFLDEAGFGMPVPDNHNSNNVNTCRH